MTPAVIGLAPELIEQVEKLTPEQRDKLRAVLDALDGPPNDRTEAEIAALIKQRSDDYHAGKAKLLTPEEVEQNVRATLRRYGYEL